MIYSVWIDQLHTFFFIICSLVASVHSDVPRPRGVSLSKASLYLPTKDFTCFDGTATIPFSYINDDYCDCFDGSDEPGTSACLNGIFHCVNAGYRPQNIPSSRVNDGVCDCCDGTDEYSSSETCSNSCALLGKEAREEAQRIAELHKAGSQFRLELIEKGNKKRMEMADQLAQLHADKVEAEKIKAEKEYLKNELESKENEALKVYREAEELEKQKKAEEEREIAIKESMEHFVRFDSDSDEILTHTEIKSVNVFDKNKDGEVDEEELKFFFGDRDSVDKETFVTAVWPILKPFIMMEQGMFQPAKDEEDDHETESEAEEQTEDIDTGYPENEEDKEDADVELPNDETDEHESEPESNTGYDEETQKLVDEATEARRQYADAERTVREIEANMKNLQQNMDKDYGLQHEFATLDGQCLEYEDKEYVYKLCHFQKVTQKSKNGGMEIGLGNWGEWAGKDNKYAAMKYTNGIACWNGPNRMTTVNIQCGLENKLLSVSEPYRCEYLVELSTPAACDESYISLHSTHDEL